jgi:hypothetical protein
MKGKDFNILIIFIVYLNHVLKSDNFKGRPWIVSPFLVIFSKNPLNL